MTYHTPKYFEEFSCRASACTDSCCRAGWEIPIDPETYGFYSSAGIDIDKNSYVDPDGDRAFTLREDKTCPYFRADGLCDIYIRTDGRLCEICTKYPRFFEEYDGFSEAGLSISCPTAAELILGRDDDPYIDLQRKTPDRLLDFLVTARARAMDMIYSEADPDSAAAKLFGYGLDLQDLIDYDELSALDELDFVPTEVFDDRVLASAKEFILSGTDILTERWKELLTSEFGGTAGTVRERRNYLAYLTHRYFLKAINYENTALICGFVLLLYLLAGRLSDNYTEVVRLISKEIEHDSENVEKLVEFIGNY